MRAELWTTYESPIGQLTLVGGDGWLSRLYFPGRAPRVAAREHDADAFAEVTRQLDEYLHGLRRELDVEVERRGTPFQLAVWDELARIPYGETISYTELADRLGRADRLQAVAGTVTRTPAPIVIPCHRVVGADGSLRGYAGGLQRKAALLSLERGQLAMAL
jgi:methylated-DNA-[protein]-cysteine S-methyltransferase